MSTRTTSILVLALIAIAIIVGLILWPQMPDQMASHWNANDEVDGYISRPWGILLMPIVTLGMFLLFITLPNMDPLKANIVNFREAFNMFILLITTFMLYIHGLTLAWSLGYQSFKMSAAMLPFMGILFMAIGYLLHKAKRNFFIGIRTPWTLSSDTVWNKTHQLGAKLYVFSGLLAFVGGFVGGQTAVGMLLIPLLGSTLFLVIYSYVLYRKESAA